MSGDDEQPDPAEPRRTVYLETSVLSYLTARRSGDLVTRAHQKITLDWWQARNRYELFTSLYVLQEIRSCAPPRSSWRYNVMWEDPIVDEIHRFRREWGARFNHDLNAMTRDLQERFERGEVGELEVVTRAPRPAEPEPLRRTASG